MSDLDSSLSLPAAAAALSAEDRAGLVNALKDKLHDLAEQHVDVMESLPPRVRNRVEALKNIQGQHDELEAKFLEERAALEAKYQNLYQPFYKKRSEIVNGSAEVEGVTDGGNEAKGVPDFWLTAMKSNEILAAEISENDIEALKYLKDIKWSKLDDPKGFKLEFLFDTNPFFKNSVLTKTYHMIDDDEPILEKAIGTVIEWHPAKCLTQKVLKKKPKKGMPKNAKITVKIEKCESFFNFFNPPEVPEDEDDIDDDAAEELQNLMEQDYDIGSTIRDKIIPHAVSWFTGEAAEDDGVIISDDDEDDEDEDEDEDEEEDEDDDEDEDEEEEEVAVKGRKKKIGGGQAGEEGQAECKQQ